MAYGPEITAEYEDDQTIRLAEPTRHELATLVPVEDEDVLRYLRPGSQELLRSPTPDALIDGLLEHEQYTNWGVYADGHLTGITGYFSDASFYTFLLAPGARGKGVGTRATRLMIATTFLKDPELQEVLTLVDEHNQPSLGVVRKLGMVEGPDPLVLSGVTMRIFGLSRPEASTSNAAGMLQALGETSLRRLVRQ